MPPVEAVRGLSFSVEAGEFFGLLGPNGAGKSTTLGCITTLIRPTSGRILVDGVDVHRDPMSAKRRIAVVPQQRNLDRDLSVREILTYHGRYFGLPAGEREARTDRLLADMEIADKAAARPRTLSGGVQQRVMIARALMHDPKVLFLDEPTTGLDPQARRRVWELLASLHARGLSLLLTTHNMEEADRLCQRLAIIDHGRILRIGTSAELKGLLPGGHILDLSLYASKTVAPRLGVIDGVVRVERLARSPDSANDHQSLRVFVDSADGIVERVLQSLRDAGAEVRRFSLTPPSLEDVYLHLTGKELRE
jgi:ABC-2 type transport system ATP-binding protein